MRYIDIYIIKKFDVSSFKVNVPKIYTNVKEETKLSYLLLNCIYYKNYEKFLDISSISKDKNGKPIFLKNDLYFNISHCNTYVTCSLATVNIGIDIEEDRLIKYNTEVKIKHIDDKFIDTINVWNIKEAYSKYLGIGLKLDFSKISINEIKKNVNLISNKYSIENKNIYFSLCYNLKEKNLINNINFMSKEKLIEFYRLT